MQCRLIPSPLEFLSYSLSYFLRPLFPGSIPRLPLGNPLFFPILPDTRMGSVGLSLVHLVERVEVNLELTSLTSIQLLYRYLYKRLIFAVLTIEVEVAALPFVPM